MQILYGINPVSEILGCEGADVRRLVLAEGRRGDDLKSAMNMAEDAS